MIPAQRTAATYLGTWEPGTPEWHAARAKGVGGSEVAPIIGISPWESRFSLWHRKKGTIPQLDLNDEMEWGKRLEPVIAQKYEATHPNELLAEVGTYSHPDRPWQIANPDRMRLDKDGNHLGPLEIKYSLFGDEWGPDGTEQIPPYYRTQALWYLDTLGYDTCMVAVFIGGSATYREYTIHADETDQAWLREQVKDFLDDLDTGALPDIDGHTATYKAVKELHPEIDGEKAELSDAVATAYITAQAGKKAAEETCREAACHVIDHMGSAQSAYWRKQKIATRRAKNGGTPYLQAERNIHLIPLPEGTPA